MIGSHDSMTYCKSTSWIYNNCKKYWKTQCKTLEQQYEFGIRFFDLRVYRDNNAWKFAHGIVNLKAPKFNSLKEICSRMKFKYPEAIYRIVLEKGEAKDRELFCSEALNLCDEYDNLWRVDIKSYKKWDGYICNNNQKLFNRGYKFALVNPWEKPANELHGGINGFSDLFYTDLRKDAKKINSTFTFFEDKELLKKMLESKDELYFLDYCTNEY